MRKISNEISTYPHNSLILWINREIMSLLKCKRSVIAYICLNMGILWRTEKIMLKYSLFKGFFYIKMNYNTRKENTLHIGKI
jgi:hypothetical protein